MTHRETTQFTSHHTRRHLVDETEAAEMLGLSKRTLQAWRVRGGGPPFLKLGRLVRYDTTSLWDWVTAHVAHNTSVQEG
jgi:excisionase family DNA binding protein